MLQDCHYGTWIAVFIFTFLSCVLHLSQDSQIFRCLPASRRSASNGKNKQNKDQKMAGEKILIVDDEISICNILQKILTSSDYQVTDTQSGQKALEIFANEEFDAVLLDLSLIDSNGIDIANEMLKLKPMVPIILISGKGKIADAVTATKIGVYDFLEKPPDRERILITLRNALAHFEIRKELEQLKQDSLKNYQMIGDSPAIRKIYQEIEQIADKNSYVLISGESGVGKELVALAIHQKSQRAKKPLIKINCAAIPATLIEAELFGYTKGAFTGAYLTKQGRLQVADGGTVFLDEIGELPLEAQAKVLRFMDSGEIQRIGSTQTKKVNVRVLAASNKNLEEMIETGKFRKDLYYRINVFNVHVPPLRERKEDIPLLVDHFLQYFSEENGLVKPKITPSALSYLSGYHWPGNVRELRNVVERMMIISNSDLIDLNIARRSLHTNSPQNSAAPPSDTVPLKEAIRSYEREYILNVLERNNWKVAAAADVLGIDRANLYRKMKGLEIKN